MKKLSLITTLILLNFLLKGQATLHVLSGQTEIIKEDRKNLIVQNWIMEDNSTIIIHESVDKWIFKAENAIIGDNVSISARGKNGKTGEKGAVGRSSIEDCKNGKTGKNGATGENGFSGKDLDLEFNIQELGNIIIDASGGNGGLGGNGGKGGAGTEASCGKICSGGDGGNGGNGGPGGTGGIGGNVSIKFKYDITAAGGFNLTGLKVISQGGRGGNGGLAGEGGNGGRNKRKCGIWPYFHKGGGSPGGGGIDNSDKTAASGIASNPTIILKP